MKSFEKYYKDHGSVKFGVIIPFPRGGPKITFKATLSLKKMQGERDLWHVYY